MSLSVQSRAVSSSAIQASDGVAVSMAIASRERGSASTWTFVATGPTTRLRRSNSRSGLELLLHAIEGLADHLVGRPLDEPRPDAGERAGQVHVRVPVHDGRAVRAVRETHLRGRVHR